MREVWLANIERQSWMHASIQATLYNAHFDNKGMPWTADDLMGRGNREKRKAQQLEDRMATMRIQQKIMAAKDDDMPDVFKQLAENRRKTTVN